MGINDIFQALSDPTRREILRLLRRRDMSAGELAERFPLAEVHPVRTLPMAPPGRAHRVREARHDDSCTA